MSRGYGLPQRPRALYPFYRTLERLAACTALAVVSVLVATPAASRADGDPSAGESPHGFERIQCTWWADWKAWWAGWDLQFSQGSGRDAWKWWDLVTNTRRSDRPEVGSIMVLDRYVVNGEYNVGHVGCVIAVNGDSFTLDHSNWPLGVGPHHSDCTFYAGSPNEVRIESGSRHAVRGFLCPPGGDTTAPVVNFSHPNPTGRWYRSNERVDWHITDEGGSGVKGFGQSWTGDPGYAHGGADGYLELSWAGQGQWTANVHAWDNADNNQLYTRGWFGYDISPPSVALTGGTPQHWYNAATSAAFSSSDAYSGVKTRAYRWHSSDGWTAGAQAAIPEGKHALEARAEDDTWNGASHDGNVAIASLGEFWMDTAAPTADPPGFDIPSPAGEAAATVAISASGSDALSGIATLEVLVDGVVIGSVPGASGTVPWTVTSVPAGDHAVNVRATDNAGNVATGEPRTYTIERTPPVTTATPDRAPDSGGWYVSPVTVTLDSTDASGVRSKHYAVDGGAEQVYTNPFVVTGDGAHSIAFWSYDATNPAPGNREEAKSVAVSIDTTPPEPPAVLDEGAITDNPSVLGRQWTGGDPDSGISAYQYAVTDNPGAPDSALTWSATFPASGASAFFQAPSLRLVPGPTYYLRVRLQNGAGAWGVAGQSDGITVSGTALPNRLRHGLFASGGATEDSGPALGSLGEPAVCTLDGNTNGLPGDLLTQPSGLGYLLAGFWQSTLAASADSVLLEPAAVVGGETVRATVYLAEPAPFGGAIVSISTDDPAALPGLPSQVTVPGGETSVAFETATAPRTAGSIARIDATYAATASAELHIRAYHSMTYVIDRTGTVGEPAILRAYLYGVPGREKLAGRSVAFQVEGTSVGSAVTNADGRADLAWTITTGAARRTLLDSFAGDMDYAPSSGNATLTSIVWTTKMVGFDRSGRITDRVQLKAVLFRSDNTRLPGKLITLAVDGSPVGSDTTDSEGRAEFYYTIPDGAGAGSRTILAAWAGDGGYLAQSVSRTLTVQKALPYIWVLPKSVPRGGTAALYAYFRRLSDYQKQVGKAVDFRVDGTSVGAAVTDATGVARYAYITTQPTGEYTLRCEFAGDPWLDPGSGEARLRIY